MSELKPCPFCKWHGARLVSKTEHRMRNDGLVAYEFIPDVGFGPSYEREIPMFDFRHTFYVKCNKCHARGPLARTQWHVRTEEEVEDFSMSEKYFGFEPESEFAREAREKAIREWNTRAERTCKIINTRNDTGECSLCGSEFNIRVINSTDYAGNGYYCPCCGAKVID